MRVKKLKIQKLIKNNVSALLTDALFSSSKFPLKPSLRSPGRDGFTLTRAKI